jgi:two-component system sensor histidine kinase KdpD
VLPDVGRREPPPRAWSEPWDPRSQAVAVLMVAVATALGFLVYNTLGQADVVMLYMLCITVAATRFGRWTTLITSGLSILTYDFCFIDPRYTFVVTDFQHVGAFAMMLGMGWVIIGLAERIRAQTRLAQERERHTRALYRVGKVLAEGGSQEAIRQRVESFLRRELNVPAALFLCDPTGELETRPDSEVQLSPADLKLARAAMDLGVPMGQGTESYPQGRCLILPMPGTEKAVGVLVLPAPEAGGLPADQFSLLVPLASQVSLALERASIAEERTQARIRAEHEQLRSTLLSSISHDLRTPLGSITGATSTLLDPGPEAAPGDQKVLLNTIHHESRRLLRMVNNLLDITKLESGVQVRKEWVAIEEVVGSALSHLEEQLGARSIAVDLPELWIHLDPLLVEQALINLLDNALKFSPPGSPIEIRGWVEDNAFKLQVADQGPGIPAGEEELIFEKLYRGTGGALAPGAGLGLAICRAIVQTHGGTIVARNRPQGGTQVTLALPMETAVPDGLPPELDVDCSHELPGATHES